MKSKLNIICIFLALITGIVYGDVIYAQPETREVYSGGEILTGTPTGGLVRAGFYQAPTYDGNAIFAFKLPTVPEGMVIETATFKWFYDSKYSKRNTSAIDLYGMSYRAAATDPLITAADYYLGASDPSATMIQGNVINFALVGSWLSTDTSSKALANYLQAQYDSGAQPNDWALLRMNPRVGMTLYATNGIRGPQYADPAYYPYIEYTLGVSKLKMVAQPESKEVYFNGQLSDGDPADPSNSRIAYCSSTDGLWDGNLILAFKLPTLPAGKVIKSASFNWFYVGHGSRTGAAHDLYALDYKPAATSPLISAADYYVGISDAAATKISGNVTDFDAAGQWLGTDAESKLLAAYIQAQYKNGAIANDWVFLRFNPVATFQYFALNRIAGPNAADTLTRPYIELEFADASEGYWKALNVSPVHIDPNGINTTAANYYVGATTVNNSQQTIDLLVPFAFPQLAAGEYVGEVYFVSEISSPYQFPGRYFDIDLYGLAYRSSATVQSSDYWVGPYSVLPEEGLNGTPIASEITQGMSVQPATWQLSEEGSQRAANYINAQKAAGATASSYGFFRLNPRYNALYYTRQMFSYPEIAVRVTTAAPAVLPTPATEYACPTIGYLDYPVADEDGDCQVTLADLKIVVGRWLECFAEPASYYCQ